jgi:hypothetical protein
MALDYKALEKSMVHIMVFMYKTLNKHKIMACNFRTPCHVVVGRTQVTLDYPHPIVFKSSKIHNSSK